jgi:hypothetical protein
LWFDAIIDFGDRSAWLLDFPSGSHVWHGRKFGKMLKIEYVIKETTKVNKKSGQILVM